MPHARERGRESQPDGHVHIVTADVPYAGDLGWKRRWIGQGRGHRIHVRAVRHERSRSSTVQGADDAVPARLPEVVWRAGLDLNPLDVTDPDQVRWLELLVWPGQEHRLEALRGALEVARADPPRLVRGDLTTDLPALAAEAPRDATLVIFHTAVLAYVPADGRRAFREALRATTGRLYVQIRRAGERRPLEGEMVLRSAP